MSTVEELGKTADSIAGNEASSLRSPEAQASYFVDKAQVAATMENTKAVQELTKTIDTMAMGLIGELMSLKETLATCLEQSTKGPFTPVDTEKEKVSKK